MRAIINPSSVRRFVLRMALSFFLALLSTFSARAMTINVTYDSSVTNISTLTNIQTAFGAAAQTIGNLYTNNATINITVYSAHAGPFGNIGLGESSFFFQSGFTYAQVTNALFNSRTTSADSNSLASLPTTDPTGSQSWAITTAEEKALNLISPNGAGNDGSVGFATNFSYTFDPNNRAVSGKIDFIGVAEHELTEVMGRSTHNLNGTYYPYDLFRFTNNGARSFNVNANNAYFSVDNGVTKLKLFNGTGSGDIQDWAISTPADSFDASGSSGRELILSAADLTSLDVIGYKLNYRSPLLKGARLANGNFQLTYTNTPGTTYAVFATTNLSLNITNWTILGTNIEHAAGQFQFTDTQATTNKLRFYRVRLN